MVPWFITKAQVFLLNLAFFFWLLYFPNYAQKLNEVK